MVKVHVITTDDWITLIREDGELIEGHSLSTLEVLEVLEFLGVRIKAEYLPSPPDPMEDNYELLQDKIQEAAARMLQDQAEKG